MGRKIGKKASKRMQYWRRFNMKAQIAARLPLTAGQKKKVHQWQKQQKERQNVVTK